MFEKIYPDDERVVIENGVIALFDSQGQVAKSNVDFYYDERGYDLESEDEAADMFKRHFGKDREKTLFTATEAQNLLIYLWENEEPAEEDYSSLDQNSHQRR